MGIQACIFDLDGVLCDTSRLHYLAWKETAEKLGVSFTIEDNHQLKGVSRVGSLQYILDKGKIQLSDSDFAELMHEKNEMYVRSIAELSQGDLLPGVMELLEDLQKHDVKIALGSSSKNARLVLDKTGIKSYFEAVVDGNDVERTKPDPEVFLKGAQMLGVDPQHALVLEDAPKGLKAAQAGGFHHIGIGGEELKGMAEHVYEDCSALSYQKINELFS